MEFPYGSLFTKKGGKQPKLHTKFYQFIKDDVHHRLKSREGNPEGGLLCQDCHTTTSMHGNGNITGTLLANVEIECSDCHGIATHFPWELPLGYGDEFGNEIDISKARGLSDKLLATHAKFSTPYDAKDGYLLTTRGNPFNNVVSREDQQLQTAGHHWPLDGPLPKEMRDNMERQGVCLSCHRDMPEGKFVYQIISKVGDALGMVPKTDAEHMKLIGKAMFIAANLQIFGPFVALILVILFVVLVRKRRTV
jgi:hypothetical protein